MTTSLTDRAALPARRSRGVRAGIRGGVACGALATLLLAGSMPAALAQQVNRVYAGCTLSASTVSALQGHIQTTGNPRIANAVVTYVVVYAVSNDNNGQALVQPPSTVIGFTGPVICRNPNASITSTLQTTDIPNIDILDVQDALILRHAQTGPTSPGRNRICHTTDGVTDCFNIQ